MFGTTHHRGGKSRSPHAEQLYIYATQSFLAISRLCSALTPVYTKTIRADIRDPAYFPTTRATYRGSLLATFNNFPRKSEESTYFESNASTAVAVPVSRGGGGGGGGSVDGGGEPFAAATTGGPQEAKHLPVPEKPTSGNRNGGVATAVMPTATAQNEKAEGKRHRTEEGAGEEGVRGGGGSEGGSSTGRESTGGVVHAADPAALLRPPRVGTGKLEHDKERRLGVASDLEAVIAVSGDVHVGRFFLRLWGVKVGCFEYIVCCLVLLCFVVSGFSCGP